MGYKIMYGRQFIKTTRGIIPLALCGSNNVTERINGREVRERHWCVYGKDKTEYTPEEYLAYAESFCGTEFQQHFMSGGKWVNDKGWLTWVRNEIKQALTIEEIRAVLPVQGLTCSICVGEKDSYLSRQEDWRHCNTTPDLESWLDNAYLRLQELEGSSRYAYISLSLYGRQPLKIQSRREPEGQVLIAVGKNNYVTELEHRSYSYSTDISNAIVFESTNAARNRLAHCGHRFDGKMRFVKAENKFAVKNYRILAKTDLYPNGVYIKQLTSRALRFTYNPEYALKFTEQAARKYVTKLGNRFRGVREYLVVNVAEGGAV